MLSTVASLLRLALVLGVSDDVLGVEYVHGGEAFKEVDDIAAGISGPYRPSIHQSDMDASTFHRCRIPSLPFQ